MDCCWGCDNGDVYDKQRGILCCLVALGACERVYPASACVCVSVRSRCVPIGGPSRVGTTCHTVVAPGARHACCRAATGMIWLEGPSCVRSASVTGMASVGLLSFRWLRRTRGMLWMCLHTLVFLGMGAWLLMLRRLLLFQRCYVASRLLCGSCL
jgi:hypothetical protein